MEVSRVEGMEPALESLCESTAYPALTGNEVNCFAREVPGRMIDG